ncbi:MAG TPA: TonB family protein [Candidatus Acidoferrum sp.]|nr:TonB family protein [Candidatus Acidoferrum sp.]
MISRFLVPIGARPPAADAATQRRRPTTMDERTLVPATLPIVPLNGQTKIPSDLPLESIAARVVVPRDVKQEAYGVKEDFSVPLQPTDLDARITVPAGAAPPAVIEPLTLPPPVDLVDPDIFMTGEVQLVTPEQKEEGPNWQLITRASSVVFHLALLGLILMLPKWFPYRPPTQEEIELARNQLRVLLPPGAFETSKPSLRPTPPSPKVHLDPRVLREVAPEPQPAPAPQPEKPVKELPSAPVPKANAVAPDPQPVAPTPKTDTPKPALKLEAPDAPQPQHGLILPKNSINRSLQDTIRDAAKNPNASGGRSGLYSGPMPKAGGGLNGGSNGQQGAGGTFGNGYEILTPTEGVDFSDYMARVVAAVRRNWYAVMPESAMLGDRGRVALEFSIMKNGSVPDGDPVRIMSSGKEPLDRAAVSAIRSSNPFEPLPPAFSGPYIRLRFIFLYNLPIEAAYQ